MRAKESECNCSKPSGRLDWYKLIPWFIALVFAAGGVYASTARGSSDIVELRSEIRSHVDAPAHHDTARRMALAESRVGALEEQRRDVGAELRNVNAALALLTRRIDKLCAVTPRCKE